MNRAKDYNKLNRKEQATTATYKLMCAKVNDLERSLEKTQDESEKIRVEKNEIEKRFILLESDFKKQPVLEVFKFLSSGGFGFAVNYFTSGSIKTSCAIGVPSVLIYLICVYFQKKS